MTTTTQVNKAIQKATGLNISLEKHDGIYYFEADDDLAYYIFDKLCVRTITDEVRLSEPTSYFVNMIMDELRFNSCV
jgi:hypothetical protein